MVEEGVVYLSADRVDVAPRARGRRQVIIAVDVEGVDEGSRAIVVVEDDGKTPLSYVLLP